MTRPVAPVGVLAGVNTYLLGLLVAAAWGRRRRPSTLDPPGELSFAVIVPAHDEEASVGETLASLRKVDDPPARDAGEALAALDAGGADNVPHVHEGSPRANEAAAPEGTGGTDHDWDEV